MRDAFQNTQVKEYSANEGGFLRNFQFVTGVPIPIQILNPDIELFPSGFPEIDRHWIEGPVDPFTGKPKFLPPVVCTAKMESSQKRCLCCYGKAQGSIKADRGSVEAGTELIVPLFDHARYRKNPSSNKYEPIPHGIPLDPSVAKGVLMGGLKIMYATAGQFRSLRTEHENVQNECAVCNAPVQIMSLSCEECECPVYEPQQLAMMTQDQFREVKYEPKECLLCRHTGILTVKRKCSMCPSEKAKGLYDLVLWAQQTKTPNKTGNGTKTVYSFTEAKGMPVAVVPPEDAKELFTRINAMITVGPTIKQQADKLGIQPPKEWLQDLNTSTPGARPYAQS